MKLVMSTPGAYIDALKKQDIAWPVKYDDGFPYSHDDEDFWTGFFTSRPGAKKQVKDASSLFEAEMKLMSLKVISEDVQKGEVEDVLRAKQSMLE
jgi:hypothetical protein